MYEVDVISFVLFPHNENIVLMLLGKIWLSMSDKIMGVGKDISTK